MYEQSLFSAPIITSKGILISLPNISSKQVCPGMDATSISHHAIIQMFIPALRLFFDSRFQHALESLINVLNLPYRLNDMRLTGFSLSPTFGTSLKKLLTQLTVSASIPANIARHTKSANPVLQKHLCTGCGTLVGNFQCFSPPRKTALHSQNVTISSACSG